MNIKFRSIYLKSIYHYIKLHDGQTILYKDIMDEYAITYPTVRKCVQWLLDRELIKKVGKKMWVASHYD